MPGIGAGGGPLVCCRFTSCLIRVPRIFHLGNCLLKRERVDGALSETTVSMMLARRLNCTGSVLINQIIGKCEKRTSHSWDRNQNINGFLQSAKEIFVGPDAYKGFTFSAMLE